MKFENFLEKLKRVGQRMSRFLKCDFVALVQNVLKIDLKTLRHELIFQWKLKYCFFHIWCRRDLGSANFSLKYFSKLDFFGFKVAVEIRIFCSQVPPTLDLERATSQLSLENKINVVAFLDQFLKHFEVCAFWAATSVCHSEFEIE